MDAAVAQVVTRSRDEAVFAFQRHEVVGEDVHVLQHDRLALRNQFLPALRPGSHTGALTRRKLRPPPLVRM